MSGKHRRPEEDLLPEADVAGQMVAGPVIEAPASAVSGPEAPAPAVSEPEAPAPAVSEPEAAASALSGPTVVATASNPRFTVSRVDIDRPGPTFTIDTLRDLREQRGKDVEMFFITGADALAQILTWKDAEELFDLAHFVGVTRPGHTLSGAGLPQQRVSLLEVPAMSISSTDCRARVRSGEPVWYLVPDGVVQYIAKHRLYRADA